jgi:cytochrome P450
MALISELDLPHLPITSVELGNDPCPFFAAARSRHEWLASSDLGFVVTSYRAIDELLRLDSKLKMPGEEIVRIMGAEGTGWGQFAVDQMLVSGGERHSRLRGSVKSAFAPANVRTLRPIMRETISRILDEWAPKETFDFTKFAAEFPVRVMFALIGAPIDRLTDIAHCLEIHGESFNLEVEKMGVIEEAYQTLWRFVDDLVMARADGTEKKNLLDEMIDANRSGALSDVELRQLLILLFAAGFDTTKNLLILLMHSLLQHPEIYRRCGQDAEYAKKVVKEQQRFATPSNTMRIVTESIQYRDVEIPAGTMLFFPLSISGRDASVFSDSDTFNPERTERHLTQGFGRGMHLCLGQFLAIANLEEGLHAIATRMAEPRLIGAVSWKLFPGVWGITRLPIAFRDAAVSLSDISRPDLGG